jgi:radical SAM superfamily enzyme YgiQ (UPF0313 family)
MPKTKGATDFRVLIVYPNLPLMLVPALAIGIFTKILNKKGYQVDLFETTGYLPQDSNENSSPENRVKYSQARDFNYERDLGIIPMYGDMKEDFREKVIEFKPDFMIFTVVEDAFLQALSLLEAVGDLNVPHLIGGVFPTAAPDRCMEFPAIKMIGLGEGENIILATAEAIRLGKSLKNIPGTWYRDDQDTIHKSPRGPLVDINDYSPDFSLIDDRRFYRPMGGRVFRTMPIETYRGCPFTCTFCNSPMQTSQSKSSGQGNFLRRKGITELRDELREVVEKYKPEFLYFIDDSFLSRPRSEIFEFCDMYSEFALPFWFNTRPENCTEEVMKRINEAGAYRISFGLECGNEEYRRKVLLRQVSNKKIIERFDIIANSGIAFSVNLIIGFPGETRELIMDTVELVRSLSGFDTLTVSIFTPYHGTRLRNVAVRNGWLDPKTITVHTTSNSLLDMPPPYLSSVDIDGLMRVVPLYCYFPKSEWKTLRRAETDDDEGNKILAEYMTIYQDEFLGMTQDDKKNILIEGGTGCRSNPKDSFFVSAPRLTESQLISLTP